MKRLFKVLINVIAILSACFMLVSFSACHEEDIKTLELKISVYDYEESKANDYTMTVKLYRHLAPKTVDAVIKAVKNGYYNDAVFYSMNSYGGQIMLGDFKLQGEDLILNPIKLNTVKGEFENNGVTGSNLLNRLGSVGLWRDWYVSDGGYDTSSEARNSGTATWYIPTRTMSDYDGYFTVFGQIDFAEGNSNQKAFDAIKGLLADTENVTEYEIYYTGEYDEEKDNNGLEFNCVEKAEFDEGKIENLFKAESGDKVYVSYNHYTVTVGNGNIGAKVVSAKIK